MPAPRPWVYLTLPANNVSWLNRLEGVTKTSMLKTLGAP
jgi:hypothetical protein